MDPTRFEISATLFLEWVTASFPLPRGQLISIEPTSLSRHYYLFPASPTKLSTRKHTRMHTQSFQDHMHKISGKPYFICVRISPIMQGGTKLRRNSMICRSRENIYLRKRKRIKIHAFALISVFLSSSHWLICHLLSLCNVESEGVVIRFIEPARPNRCGWVLVWASSTINAQIRLRDQKPWTVQRLGLGLSWAPPEVGLKPEHQAHVYDQKSRAPIATSLRKPWRVRFSKSEGRRLEINPWLHILDPGTSLAHGRLHHPLSTAYLSQQINRK